MGKQGDCDIPHSTTPTNFVRKKVAFEYNTNTKLDLFLP